MKEELKIKKYISSLPKEKVIDLYLQKMFDEKLELNLKNEEILKLKNQLKKESK